MDIFEYIYYRTLSTYTTYYIDLVAVKTGVLNRPAETTVADRLSKRHAGGRARHGDACAEPFACGVRSSRLHWHGYDDYMLDVCDERLGRHINDAFTSPPEHTGIACNR